MKNLLVCAASWQRIAERASRLESIQALVLDVDGQLRIDGQPVRTAPVHAAWLSMDISQAQRRDFERLLLGSAALEFVQTSAAGMNAGIYTKLAQKPIVLCNSDAQAPAIAEFVLASLLARLHRFDSRAQSQHLGEWQRHPFRELCDCRAVVVGYGAIGSRVAAHLLHFGTAVSVVRRQVRALPGIDRVVTLEALTSVLPDADIVVLTNALNAQTRNLFDAEAFGHCKPGAIFVNIARGALVDEDALLEALKREQISYAILDVFREEPLPAAHPFWQHERVQVSAHTASAGSRRQARGDVLLLDNLASFLSGAPLRNQVDLGSLAIDQRRRTRTMLAAAAGRLLRRTLTRRR